MFHGTPDRDNYRTSQWNSSRLCFHLEIDDVFYSCIDHGVRYNSLLENVQLSNGYFAGFENVFTCLVTYFFCCHKKCIIIQNLFQTLSIFKIELTCTKIMQVGGSKTIIRSEFTYELKVKIFSTLILLLLFQLIKICQCCGFTITNYFFFLTATNARVTSQITFSNTRIIFSYVLIWFYHSLMEINSMHLRFRSRTMCYIATCCNNRDDFLNLASLWKF